MRKITLLFLAVCVIPIITGFNPQTNALTDMFFPEKDDLPDATPALKKKTGYTNYEELMAFLQELATAHPQWVTLDFIGQSHKGKPIPIVHIQSPNKMRKVRVWMQGGLHGDEPASTEAMLYLLHEVLNNPENTALVQNIHLAVVPMANIDGYLKQKRNNAENLDLNRDQTKLMATESPLLKKAFTDFKPHVSLDFHEYRPFRRDFVKLSNFGVTGAYDVMFLYSGNLNVPEAFRTFTDEAFLKPTRAKLDAEALTHHDYVTTSNHFGQIHFNRGSINARSSATNFALLNSISTLVEVRGVGIGRTSFKRRIYTGFLIGKSFLDEAVAQKGAIFKMFEEADFTNNEVVVKASRKVYQGELDFIDLDKLEKIQLPVTFRDALQSAPKITRAKPQFYLLEASQAELVTKLQILGLHVDTLKAQETIMVEAFQISQYRKVPQKYEKMTLQEVSVDLIKQARNFEAGCFSVATNQPNGNILTEIMEPEAPNSFVSFGLVKTSLSQILPIYRIPHD
jgi:hypothetical protein